jgi:hypothetical protein
MAAFGAWATGLAGNDRTLVYIGVNAPFDWSFVNYYFHRFTGGNSFGFAALDIKPLYMGATGSNWADTRSSQIAKHLAPQRHGDYDALHDAKYQAELFRLILALGRRAVARDGARSRIPNAGGSGAAMTSGAPGKLASALYKYVGIDGLRRILGGSIRFTSRARSSTPSSCCPRLSCRTTHQIGVLSLSRVRNSLQMWSHYADQYAGAVVEFDGSQEFFNGQIAIDYRPTRPRRLVDTYLTGAPIPVAE